MSESQVEMLSLAANWAIVVVGVASVIVAICAVVLAYKQNEQTKVHNRLSVKPIMHTQVNENDKTKIAIKIFNNGLGPALIKDIRYGLRGNRTSQWKPDAFIDFIDSELGFGLSMALAKEPNWFEFEFPHALRAGEEKILLLLESEDPGKADMRDLMEQMREKLKIEIPYESIYGDQFLMIEPKGH